MQPVKLRMTLLFHGVLNLFLPFLALPWALLGAHLIYWSWLLPFIACAISCALGILRGLQYRQSTTMAPVCLILSAIGLVLTVVLAIAL